MAEILVSQMMADPRPVHQKLSASPGLALKASGGALQISDSTRWASWDEAFVTSLPGFAQLRAHFVEALGHSRVRISCPPEQKAQALLLTALSRATSGEAECEVSFKSRAFRDYLANVLTALQGGEVEFTLCRRLIGVDMQASCIDLSDSVRLVNLTDEDLTARMPPFEMLQYGLVSPDLTPLNRVEVRVRRSETLVDLDALQIGPTRPRVLLRDSERVQEALLLMGAEGQVGLGSYIFQLTQPPLGACTAQPINYSGGGVIFPPMLVRNSDEAQLRRCFEVAQKAQAFPAIKSALHRYALACSRSRPEDSLVDLVIGFEGILLQGLQNELSHRFSLNGSSLSHWILGKPRKESYHLFRAAYAARSSVVHGYGRKLKAWRLESLSNELRHLMATFLTWLIQEAPRYGLQPRLESDDWLRLLFESPPA